MTAPEPALWRFDVPEVPPHVTALSGAHDTTWLRIEAPRGFNAWPGSWWAAWLGEGRIGPVAHFTDIVSHVPLVECPDPRRTA
jgi:hypothetical protein